MDDRDRCPAVQTTQFGQTHSAHCKASIAIHQSGSNNKLAFSTLLPVFSSLQVPSGDHAVIYAEETDDRQGRSVSGLVAWEFGQFASIGSFMRSFHHRLYSWKNKGVKSAYDLTVSLFSFYQLISQFFVTRQIFLSLPVLHVINLYH